MITLPQVRVSTFRRHRVNNRLDAHRHADEYLEKLEKMSEKKVPAKIHDGIAIAVKYAKYFAKGLETMFSAIHIK